MSKKWLGGILVFLGFMMSPLCWWNDLIFNLPIAYGFGFVFSKLSQDLFIPSSIFGYWLSNLVGILLMQYGAMNVVESSTPERNIKKDLALGILSSTAFTVMPKYQVIFKPVNLIFLLLLFLIFFNPLTIIHAGERGVLMMFGKVQTKILDEGLHFIIPVAKTVKKMNVRIQKQEISAEASSKDLQEVFTDVALNWHIIPEKVNLAFQTIGDEQTIVEAIINPVIEEILKAVMAKYTAEEIITRRENVKSEVDDLLTGQLINYHIQVDNISLVHVHFSERFMEAVETKQIAEQDAKKANFLVLKAIKEAEVKVNLAKGEAEAHTLLQKTLTPEILHKKIIDKWNGNLPLVVDDKFIHRFHLESLSHYQFSR